MPEKIKVDVCVLERMNGRFSKVNHITVSLEKGTLMSLYNIQKAVNATRPVVDNEDLLYAMYDDARNRFCNETNRATAEFDTLNESEKRRYGYTPEIIDETSNERKVIAWSKIEEA